MHAAGNASLIEIIRHLKGMDFNLVVANGFNNPHSYRGYYHELAFEPAIQITIGEMHAAAQSALNQYFEGYKGGLFHMTEQTDCWLAYYGETGIPIVLTPPEYYLLPEKTL